MKKVKFNLLTAGFVLAMAFTFSCSSDDDGGGGGDPQSGGGELGDKGNDIGNYRTVVIGTQTWMAENLNYAVEGSKCYGEGGEVLIGYDEDGNFITKTLSNAEVQANCDAYGRLYYWATAMALPSSCNEDNCSSQIQPNHRGICPSGWHIPSRDDWEVLIDYVGDKELGTKLKATSGWNWDDYHGISGNGTDDYGFSALPGGCGVLDGLHLVGFISIGDFGLWWSASEHEVAYSQIMFYDTGFAGWSSNDLRSSYILSVRCVKD